MKLLGVGEEVDHRRGDRGCRGCMEGYPEPCRCGGWVHGAMSSELDDDGNALIVRECDVCGRSEDMLDEAPE